MRYARDPKSDLLVEPNPGARAWCPHCDGAVHAKCGEILEWHWAHTGETCEEARGYSPGSGTYTPAKPSASRGTCPRCELWQRGCTSRAPEAAAWLVHYGDPASQLARVRRYAPQCPASQPVRYFSQIRRDIPTELHPSQIID